MERMLRGFTRLDYDTMPPDWRGELIEGELLMAPAPVPYHTYLAKRLLDRIEDHLGPDQEWRAMPAPTDVRVDDRNVYQPDLLVLPEGGARPGPGWEIPLPIWVIEVLSPRTGIFYAAPAPDDPPFVEVGEVFDLNTTLCLMEAMKVFEDLSLADYNNQNGTELFPPDRRFTLTRVMVESGRTVNRGDLLFVVKPLPPGSTVDADDAA